MFIITRSRNTIKHRYNDICSYLVCTALSHYYRAVPDSGGLIAAAHVQCSVFLNFFFFCRLALEQLIWESCSYPRFPYSRQVLRFLMCFDHCFWPSTPRCTHPGVSPLCRLFLFFCSITIGRQSDGLSPQSLFLFWLFYFLLWKSLDLFSFLFPCRLIIGKNTFIYQRHPRTSVVLRGATVLSSLNFSSKKKR